MAQTAPADSAAHGRAGAAGFFSHASAWLGLFLAHMRVRLQLAGLESQEAAAHYGSILALAVGGLIFFTFGYFFTCLALCFLLAWAFGGGNAWLWVLCAMALFHLAGAAGLFFWVRTKLSVPMFTATLDELRKDQEWLIQQSEKQP